MGGRNALDTCHMGNDKHAFQTQSILYPPCGWQTFHDTYKSKNKYSEQGLDRWSLYSTNIRIRNSYSASIHNTTHKHKHRNIFHFLTGHVFEHKCRVMICATKTTLYDLLRNYSPVKCYTKAGGSFL